MNAMKPYLLWFLLGISVSTWATPSPKDVSDAVHAGNLTLAEQLLQQTLKDKPDSAMAHYELGQVLTKENRHQEALRELNKAQQLDASLHFAKNPRVFEDFLHTEQSASHMTKPATPLMSRPQENGSLTGYIIGILILLGGVLVAIYWWINRSDAQRAKEQQQRQRALAQQQLAELLPQVDTLRDAELECRAGVYSPEQKQLIQVAVAQQRDAIMSAITHCKAGDPLPEFQHQQLQSETLRIAQGARSGTLPPAVAAPAFEPVMATTASGGWRDPGYQNTSQQPVIINNNTSSGGMLGGVGGVVAGVVLGEMLAGNRQHETVVYRDELSRENTNDDLPRFDGSNDDSSAGWDSDTSSIDSSNDDASSFDSGSDDAWS